MSRMLLALRAAFYAAAFVLLWAWLAASVQPLDARLSLTLPVWIRPLGWALALAGALLATIASAIPISTTKSRSTGGFPVSDESPLELAGDLIGSVEGPGDLSYNKE